MEFKELKIDNRIKNSLDKLKYINTTEIQEKIIPLILSNKNVVAKSYTGSGKTLAFGIPMIQNYIDNKQRTIVICPTRELAVQVSKEIRSVTKNIDITVEVVYGGHGIVTEVKILKKGVDILVATPGRLIDHIMNRNLKYNFDTVVLDEADRLLDMGFLGEVKQILNLIKPKNMHLFSATMDSKLIALIKNHVKTYEEVIVKTEILGKNILEKKIELKKSEKYSKLLDIIKKSDEKRVLVFVATKKTAEALFKKLDDIGYKVASIHGDKTQKFREVALNQFKLNKINVLIATDVVSRGIQVDDIAYVVSYDSPKDYDTYLHRIGRTGRMGKIGTAYSFITDNDFIEKKNRNMRKLKEIKIDGKEYIHKKFKEKRDYSKTYQGSKEEYVDDSYNSFKSNFKKGFKGFNNKFKKDQKESKFATKNKKLVSNKARVRNKNAKFQGRFTKKMR